MFNKKLFNYIVYNQFGGKDGDTPKWKTFKHNGILCPEPYKPHKIPIVYNGEKIVLDPISEEYASIYAKFTGTESRVYVKVLLNVLPCGQTKFTSPGVILGTPI